MSSNNQPGLPATVAPLGLDIPLELEVELLEEDEELLEDEDELLEVDELLAEGVPLFIFRTSIELRVPSPKLPLTLMVSLPSATSVTKGAGFQRAWKPTLANISALVNTLLPSMLTSIKRPSVCCW